MTQPIESSTTALLSLALDAAGMRQQAIAHNIANAGTPGFQRVLVSFEERLGQLRAGLDNGARPAAADLSAYQPAFVLGSPADTVALDMELASLSETVVHQQALLKVLNRHFALLGTAINEGKR